MRYIFLLFLLSGILKAKELVVIPSEVFLETNELYLKDLSPDLFGFVGHQVISKDVFKEKKIKEWQAKDFIKLLPKIDKKRYQLPEKVIVISVRKNFNQKTIRYIIRKHIKSHCQDCVLNHFFVHYDKSAFLGDFEYWEIENLNSLQGGTFSKTVKIYKKDGSQDSFFIRGKVDLKKKALVAKENILLRSHLSPSNFEEKWVKVSQFSKIFPQLKDLKNKRVKVFLPAGKTLKFNHLIDEKLVKRGQLVSVKVKNKNLTVTLVAKALTDGNLGDVVQLQNIESKKRISGVVNKKGEVHILETMIQ